MTGSYTGPLAEQAFSERSRGTILGVFHHGWYLDWGGQVLLIHDAAYGEVPFGIGVDSFETRFPYRKEWAGEEVCREAGGLCLPNGRIGLIPAEERPLTPWTQETLCRMTSVAEELLKREGRGYLRELLPIRAALVRGERPEITGDLYLTRSKDAVATLFSDKSADALRRMLGFGIGLTPSLDDWLVGMLYVLLRCPETPLGRLLVQEIPALAADCTNRISTAYLTAAAESGYFASLQQAAEARDEQGLRPLLGVGGSSGCDMLTGMLFAITYLEEKLPPDRRRI